MAATKSSTTLLSAVTTTTTSSAADCSGDYAQQVYVSIAVVGSPSGAATFSLQWSPDGGTTYYSGPTYSADVTATIDYWVIDVPVTATKVKIVFTAQTGGTSSTCTAQLGQVTGI